MPHVKSHGRSLHAPLKKEENNRRLRSIPFYATASQANQSVKIKHSMDIGSKPQRKERRKRRRRVLPPILEVVQATLHVVPTTICEEPHLP